MPKIDRAKRCSEIGHRNQSDANDAGAPPAKQYGLSQVRGISVRYLLSTRELCVCVCVCVFLLVDPR